MTDYYGFTDEGLKAHIELAKIQAESGEPQAAIANYRRFLIGRAAADRELKNSLVFQIGFLYDRQLNKKELAVMNYRWVMKNASRRILAADAEIM